MSSSGSPSASWRWCDPRTVVCATGAVARPSCRPTTLPRAAGCIPCPRTSASSQPLDLKQGEPMDMDTLDAGFLFFCPVCGIELEHANFDTPERDYYCPFCSTQLTPSAVALAQPGLR